MNKTLHTFALLFTLITLVSCSSTSSISSSNAQACNTGTVVLTADFANARMDKCKVTGENEYAITLIPENTPINPSPWYAFKVVATETTPIKITMEVQDDKHRYPPKISRDKKTWQLQPHKLTGDRMVIEIVASEQPTYISAQEVIDNQYYVDWANELKQQTSIELSQLGKSTQGRPVYKLENKTNSNEWLVILGRMHPPEVTGALALFPFVENLLSTSQLALEFQKHYNLLIIPNINPDGVFAGNWRNNANGLDLNRDWINFTQVETTQINNYLKDLVKQGNKIKFAVDFHSTREDVFYSMPTDYGVENPHFVEHWLGALDQAMPDFSVIVEPGNRPGNGVSKQYFADNFNVHAITYEVGDNTERQKIRDIAINASTTLMQSLLTTKNHDKKLH